MNQVKNQISEMKTEKYILNIFKHPLSENEQQEKLFACLSLAGIFLISFFYLIFFNQGVFFFQENKSLFFFSKEYLLKFTVKPGGLLEYTGNFLKQFYFNIFYGSFIVSLIIVLFGTAFCKVIKKIARDNPFTPLIILLPSCFLLISQAYHTQFIHHNLGFLAVIVWFSLTYSNLSGVRSILFIIYIPLLYYVAGNFAFIYAGLCVIYSLVYGKGIQRYLNPVLSLLVTFLTFLAFKEIIFLQPVNRLLEYPLTFADSPKRPLFLYLLTAYIISFPLVIKLTGMIKIRSKFTIPVCLTTILTVFSVTILYLTVNYNRDFNSLMTIERYVNEQKWDKIIESHESSPQSNIITQYYYNLALAEKGILCDRLFCGQQDFGASSLALPRVKENLTRAIYFNYAVGLIKEAHHLAVESIVIHGYQPENIKLLIKTDLIYGNHKIAERNINLLKQTLHYRKWALNYEKMLFKNELIKSDHELGQKIELFPKTDFFISGNILQNLDQLMLGNPDNRRAFEYRMAFLLLSKDLEAVVHQVKRMKYLNYTYIPTHIEEAIILFKTLEAELPYIGDLPVNPDTELRFKEYGTVFEQKYYEDRIFKRNDTIRRTPRDTFWYYYQFK